MDLVIESSILPNPFHFHYEPKSAMYPEIKCESSMNIEKQQQKNGSSSMVPNYNMSNI